MKRSADEIADMHRLKRARALWAYVTCVGGCAAVIGMLWAGGLPVANQVAAGGQLIAGVGGVLLSYYQIKVVRFRQRLALPN